MSKQNKYDDLIKTIKADEEKADAQNELTATLEEIKEGLEALKEMRQSISEAMANGAIVLKGLNAATASADNIINGICSSIIKAQNTKIKVGINDKGLQRLDERNNNAINGWSGLLGKHETKVVQLLASQRKELADITRRTEGVHLSKKVFFWLAGIWFTCTSIIISEIVLGVIYLLERL